VVLTLKLTDVATTEYVKEYGESICNARTASSCTGSLESLAFAKSKLDDCLQHHQDCVVYSKNGHQKGGWCGQGGD
jgi:hypothetical protein